MQSAKQLNIQTNNIHNNYHSTNVNNYQASSGTIDTESKSSYHYLPAVKENEKDGNHQNNGL